MEWSITLGYNHNIKLNLSVRLENYANLFCLVSVCENLLSACEKSSVYLGKIYTCTLVPRHQLQPPGQFPPVYTPSVISYGIGYLFGQLGPTVLAVSNSMHLLDGRAWEAENSLT